MIRRYKFAAGIALFALVSGVAYAGAATLGKPDAVKSNLADINSAYSAGDAAAMNKAIDQLQSNLDAAITTPTTTVAPASSTTAAPAATTTTTVSQPATGAFVHPGILINAAQIADVKAKVAANQEPWYSAFNQAKGSRYGKLDYKPAPVAEIKCAGGSAGLVGTGCTSHTDDAQAAYTDALIWVYSGDTAYRDKSLEIINAWSSTLNSIYFDPKTYVNGYLQAAWAGESFTKAAELMRYSNSGWKAADISRFEGKLRTVYLPYDANPWKGGGANWEASAAAATIQIGVFLSDRNVFNTGVAHWRAQTKAAIYLTSDGPTPIKPEGVVSNANNIVSYWNSPTKFVDGLEGETCRDLGHTSMGLASIVNGGQTATIQGVPLLQEEQTRITAGLEYNTKFIANPGADGWICNHPYVDGGATTWRTYEVAYAYYHGAQGVSLPNTKALLTKNRPKTASGLQSNWELLTSGLGTL